MIVLNAPWIFVASVVAALGVTALHFLSVHRPPVLLLPTTRFVQRGDARAISRSKKPSDLLLLVLRVLALLLAGLALAGVQWRSGENRVGHIIVADTEWRADSARIVNVAAVPDEARDAMRVVWLGDSIVGARAGGASGMHEELGAAWPAAWRAANALLQEHPMLDSVALHILAPSRTISSDGWETWRSTWPGRVSVVVRGASNASATSSTSSVKVSRDSADTAADVVVFGGPADDIVTAAIALNASALRVTLRTGSEIRETKSAAARRAVYIVRDASSMAGTSSATANATIVQWPVDGRPIGWEPREDSIGAVAARGVALLAPWVRASVLPTTPHSASTSRASNAPRTIAWWSDGEPAIIERMLGDVCIKHVGIAVPNGSDLLLSPSARGVLATVVSPCGASAQPISQTIIASETRVPGRPLASALSIKRLTGAEAAPIRGVLPPVLLLISIALLLVEWLLRERGVSGVEDVEGEMHSPTRGSRAA